MILISKKRVLAVLAVVVVAGCLIAGGILYAVSPNNYLGTIVIDAGHGGWDNGVQGVNTKVNEGELNLSVSLMLSEELKKRGYNVVLTRTNNTALGDTKQSDMSARQKIIDSARPDIVISIHMNKYSQASRRGAQVFFDDTMRGRDAAKIMQGVLNTHINAKYSNRSDLAALPGDYYIAKCYPCPSMIVECGFLSNAADEKLLIDKSYQKELSGRIADGVDSIFTASAFSVI